MSARKIVGWIVAGLSLAPLPLVLSPAAAAHAIIESSEPAVDGTAAGPDIAIAIKFNSRIDLKRSRLTLILPDRSERPLRDLKKDRPDRLATTAISLKPGKYSLHWQVLAVDGHLTRGDIPFTVTAPGGQ